MESMIRLSMYTMNILQTKLNSRIDSNVVFFSSGIYMIQFREKLEWISVLPQCRS